MLGHLFWYTISIYWVGFVYRQKLQIVLLCLFGHCCQASDVSVQYALTTKWVSYAGGSVDPDAVYALATDISTNAYFGGVLGSGWLENQDQLPMQDLLDDAGIGSGFVAKADSDGTLAWVSTLTYNKGKELSSAIYGVTAIDEALFACGVHCFDYNQYGDPLQFPWTDAMVSSLNTEEGTLNWIHALSEVPGSDHEGTQSAFNALVVDVSGALYVVGYTTKTNLSADSTYSGAKDAIVVKYDANGDRVWLRYLGGENDDEANAVAIGEDGLYVSGTTQSPGSWITLGDSSLPSSLNRCGFLSKLDFNGSVTYTTVLGGTKNDEILSMQTVSNVIFLAGTTSSTNFCAAHQLNQAKGSRDGFVLKLTDYGTTYQTNWFRYVGTNTLDALWSLALMDSNRVVVCGSTEAGGWLPESDEFSRSYAGEKDGFLLQLDCESGVPLWSTYVGGEGDDVVYTLAICGTSVFLAGTTGSFEWEMFGGFQDTWGDPEIPPLNTETGFVGRWSQEPGVPPVITNDIADVTVHEGERVEFFIGATSKPAPKYLWLTNGVPAVDVSTNCYVIASALPRDDATTYQCIVSNVFGCTTSSVAHVTVIANGNLTVTLAPPPAVAAGAAWQLTGGVWRVAGTVALYPGTYTVAFTNLSGWTTPETREVVITSGQTITVNAVYVAPVATAVRTVLSWTNVSLAVTRPPEVDNWILAETLPVHSVPVNYGSGVWNATDRTLTYTGTVSETVGYTVLLGAVGDYEVSGTITSMPINVTMPVTGDSKVSRGNFLRKISGTNVWIYMSQPTTKKQWSVYEDLTTTALDAFNISDNGVFQDGWIYWSDNSIGAGLVLSYSVSGPPGSTNILENGSASVNFPPPPIYYTIYGDSIVIIPKPAAEPPPPPTILNFTFNGTSAFLTFTSVVDQAYMVLTNANIAVTNGWQNCLPATGQEGTTTIAVPVAQPQLFYRVRSE